MACEIEVKMDDWVDIGDVCKRAAELSELLCGQPLVLDYDVKAKEGDEQWAYIYAPTEDAYTSVLIWMLDYAEHEEWPDEGDARGVWASMEPWREAPSKLLAILMAVATCDVSGGVINDEQYLTGDWRGSEPRLSASRLWNDLKHHATGESYADVVMKAKKMFGWVI